MSLVVVGSMAFDIIETPFGITDKIVGGAASYIALCSSYFSKDVKIVSVVGNDFPQEFTDKLTSRGINVEGVDIKKDQKSFFWRGRYHNDLNTRDTLVTELNVLADFNPVLPETYKKCDFLQF